MPPAVAKTAKCPPKEKGIKSEVLKSRSTSLYPVNEGTKYREVEKSVGTFERV